jgi:hypothetical protein
MAIFQVAGIHTPVGLINLALDIYCEIKDTVIQTDNFETIVKMRTQSNGRLWQTGSWGLSLNQLFRYPAFGCGADLKPIYK